MLFLLMSPLIMEDTIMAHLLQIYTFRWMGLTTIHPLYRIYGPATKGIFFHQKTIPPFVLNYNLFYYLVSVCCFCRNKLNFMLTIILADYCITYHLGNFFRWPSCFFFHECKYILFRLIYLNIGKSISGFCRNSSKKGSYIIYIQYFSRRH